MWLNCRNYCQGGRLGWVAQLHHWLLLLQLPLQPPRRQVTYPWAAEAGDVLAATLSSEKIRVIMKSTL